MINIMVMRRLEIFIASFLIINKKWEMMITNCCDETAVKFWN